MAEFCDNSNYDMSTHYANSLIKNIVFCGLSLICMYYLRFFGQSVLADDSKKKVLSTTSVLVAVGLPIAEFLENSFLSLLVDCEQIQYFHGVMVVGSCMGVFKVL